MTGMSRRSFAAGAALAPFAFRPAAADSHFPDRPIRFVVPNNAGGIADSTARFLQNALADELGKAVVVENRPGASGAVAGSLVGKKIVPASSGTFPTHGGLFVGLLIGVILIVGGLTFFPALSLGPIVEHLAMQAGTFF